MMVRIGQREEEILPPNCLTYAETARVSVHDASFRDTQTYSFLRSVSRVMGVEATCWLLLLASRYQIQNHSSIS